MPDSYSDDSMLSEEEKRILRELRADEQITRETPPEQRSALARGKQAFPIGIKPDGSVNRVEGEENPH